MPQRSSNASGVCTRYVREQPRHASLRAVRRGDIPADERRNGVHSLSGGRHLCSGRQQSASLRTRRFRTAQNRRRHALATARPHATSSLTHFASSLVTQTSGTFANITQEFMTSMDECVTCPRGSSCPAGSLAPTPCLPGSFAANTSSDVCDKCPAGKYTKDVGSTRCFPCPIGEQRALKPLARTPHAFVPYRLDRGSRGGHRSPLRGRVFWPPAMPRRHVQRPSSAGTVRVPVLCFRLH